MRHTLFKILTLFFIAYSSAQEIDVSGNVQDETGFPIPGANVIVNGTSKGTTTDFDGNFTLEEVEIGSTISISYIGYITKEIIISDNSELTIQLQEDLAQLDEVVVIGYGSQKKKDVTGAVAIVDSKTIEDLKPVDAAQALQGTSAGVAVTAPSGSPGGGFNILIRGVSSNRDNGPLVIIDGYKGDLNTINPSDIESFSILKDAQAAIYGIEGANGVVLVTTKSGKKNAALKISYNGFTGVQQTSRKLPYLNATEYALILNESHAANGEDLPFPDVSGLGVGINWQDEVFGTAPIMNHNLSASGGGEKSTYYVGASYVDQEGIVAPEKSNFRRANVKIKLGFDIGEKLKFTTSANYFNSNRQSIGENALGTPLFNALNYAPTYSLDQEDETGFLGNEVINPLSQLANTYNDYTGNAIEGTFQLVYTPLEGLSFTSRIGIRSFNDKGKTFAPIVEYGSGKVFNNPRSSVNQYRNTYNSYTWETFANYKRTLGENHNTEFTFGTSTIRDWSDGLNGTGFDVPNNSWEFAEIDLADGINETKNTGSYVRDSRLSSYFGRVQYDYKGKYLLSAMIRRDGSSDFSPENRIDYFSSVTAGWKISDEAFLEDSNTINFLKLRGSYGTLGNNEGADLYRSLLSGEATYVLDGAITNGRASGRIPNPDAQWETAKKFDVGLDLNMFDNKLTFVADYFIEDREDLLIGAFPVSGILGGFAPGAGLPTVNAGTTRNTGIELAVGYKHQFSDDASFGINYNVTKIEGEVLEVRGGIPPRGGNFSVGQPFIAIMEPGQPIGYFLGYKTDGLFQNQAEVDASAQAGNAAPGDIRFVDVDNDGEITDDDRTYLGKPQPDYIMGLNLSFDYKNWDFGAYMYAELGKETVRNYERDQSNVNRLKLYLNRWTGEGTSNSVPRVTNGGTTNRLFSDFYVEDSSFLRIQNIQLGYSLSDEVIEKLGIHKLRLYTLINNPFTFTKYNGYDPAATNGAAIGGGIDYGFYPVARQFIIGLNLSI
ncbi:TonB-dependent receptor [Tamlana sp. 2201CG12-4]|uniref:SusC/RagA family TonB-linked outer membrane protein n=1 Tax=Tamlana sp. 2201CG12-4 TaxID=3112582 RepID=UPI002DBA6F44|nr:TonB-dependent receptor [Tamlana sp. 2201CG12-4]MEC3906248.1 TonB-dependent receptor [Tamlana sp. 2201CG12-4]